MNNIELGVWTLAVCHVPRGTSTYDPDVLSCTALLFYVLLVFNERLGSLEAVNGT